MYILRLPMSWVNIFVSWCASLNLWNLVGALLNTGTEWNRTEYTGISRNIQNDAGMKRNGQE